MKDRIAKNLITWFFFTFLLGILPIIIQIILTAGTRLNFDFSITSMSKELFFVTIILCADILKTLRENENKKIIKEKTFIHGLSIFMLVISSVLYGFILVIDRNINDIFIISSIIICLFSAVIGIVTQIIDGWNF